MSLKSGALLSLFSGVSFTDLQRAATRRMPDRNAVSPTAAAVAYATRFAGPRRCLWRLRTQTRPPSRGQPPSAPPPDGLQNCLTK